MRPNPPPADRPKTILRDCRLIDVHTGEIRRTDLTLRDGLILSTEPVAEVGAATVVACDGLYAAPGLIDAHMHVDTTFLPPSELARLLVPWGTTTVCVDTTNIAHTGGVDAIVALEESFAGIPLKGYFAAPSYCPLDPSLETAARELGAADIATLLDRGYLSIGETVWSKIALGNEGFFDGIQLCRNRDRRVSGHGGEIAAPDLAAFDAYVAAGLQDDHCVATPADILPRLRRGLRLFCVEAPGRTGQLGPLLDEALRLRLPLRHFCLCVDNITVVDMVTARFGYQDHLLRIAFQAGVRPVEAFRMATLNAAEHYRLSHRLGSLAPGRAADILLLREPDAFPPEMVWVDGRLVARAGQMIVPVPASRFPAFYRHTVDLGRVRRPALDLAAAGDRVRARVIEVWDARAFNRAGEAVLPVREGVVQSDPSQDILRMVVAERYGRHGSVGKAFAQGFGLRRGALATSLSVPSNNLVAVGVDGDDIWAALEQLRAMQGGFVVVAEGRVLAQVSLPYGGIMAEQPYEDLLRDIAAAHAAAAGLGCGLANPFFTLAQTVLSTLPDLGVTDQGLVDSRIGRVVPTLMGAPA